MEKPTKRTVAVPYGHGFKTRPLEFYHPLEVDAYIAHLERRAEAAEAKLAELEKQRTVGNGLMEHLEKCSEIVSRWPEWKKKGSDAAKFIQTLDDFETGYLNGHIEACKNRPAPAINLGELVPSNDLLRVLDFAKFVIKCVRKNGEYAPVSSQEPDEIDAILRNIEEAGK